MKHLIAIGAALSMTFVAVPVFAQDAPSDVSTVSSLVHARPTTFRQGAGAGRAGFTILVNLGVGLQDDRGLEESAVGLAGANLGIGGFVTPRLAVLGRFSGTNATYDGGFGQVSGVVGATVQYWTSERVAVELGGGIGFWTTSDLDLSERAPGLILGVTAAVGRWGGNNLLIGVEYAPAYTESGTVHNFGFTVGYQFHKTR